MILGGSVYEPSPLAVAVAFLSGRISGRPALGRLPSSGFQARATLCIRQADALAALPGLPDGEITVIPGTFLAEIAVSDSTAEAAAGQPDKALQSVPTFLTWLELPAEPETVCAATRLLPEKSPLSAGFAGFALALALGLILLLPAPKSSIPISLSKTLVRTLLCLKKRWWAILTVFLLFPAVLFLRKP